MLIVTAASKSYESALLALVGSVRCNWPDAPRIRIYDLGITEFTRQRLAEAKIEVRKVPPFCEHWRSHFTWRFWIFNDLADTDFLWLDAGVCVLNPLPEVFEQIRSVGYFCIPNNVDLNTAICAGLRSKLAIGPSEFQGRTSVVGGVIGFGRDTTIRHLLSQAYSLALDEQNLRSTDYGQFHDQSLISVMLYRSLGEILFCDERIYACDTGPGIYSSQKVWIHRRSMRADDVDYFHRAISSRCERYTPLPPAPRKAQSLLLRLRIAIAKYRGRFPEKTTIYDGVRD